MIMVDGFGSSFNFTICSIFSMLKRNREDIFNSMKPS